MRNFIGVLFLTAGALLLLQGLDAWDSVRTWISGLLRDVPGDRRAWLLVGGAVAATLGAGLLFLSRRSPS